MYYIWVNFMKESYQNTTAVDDLTQNLTKHLKKFNANFTQCFPESRKHFKLIL